MWTSGCQVNDISIEAGILASLSGSNLPHIRMKTSSWVVILLVLATVGLQAQNAGSPTGSNQTPTSTTKPPADTAYRVQASGANQNVWQRETYETGPKGQVVKHVHQFTELATGLNHLVNGQWVASKEEIHLLPNGTAAATSGQHQAYFPGNIYSGVIRMVTPDGQVLLSRPVGMSYDDGTNTVMIAELTNSIGYLVGSNRVVYSNAFTGFKADLRYTYTKAGFEQDVVLRQQPPTPESLGLNADTAKLQALTEFFSPPQPSIQSTTLPKQAGLSLADENLGFGKMQMIRGRAFLLGQNTVNANAFVAKQWVQLNGRRFLVEEVPVNAIADRLATLPLTALNSSSNRTATLASRSRLLPPQRPMTPPSKAAILLAKADQPAEGFVLDYQTVNSSVTNYTFQGDRTYYISGYCNFFGTTAFEGGTIIKYNLYGTIEVDGNYVCQTGPYRPAIFTSMNDDTFGEVISGSSGTPGSGDSIDDLYIPSAGGVLKHVRFSYTMRGVTQTGLEVWDSQFSYISGYALAELGGTSVVHNVLFDNCSFFIIIQYNYSPMTLIGDQITADQCYALMPSGSSAYLTNSLFTAMGYPPPSTVTNNPTDVVLATNTGIYQVVGGGNYYLATNSPYQDFGTTNINPAVLADIATKTTYPPIVYPNQTFITNMVLAPVIPRDTNSKPDLGYHYDPLDYVFGGCDLYTNLTLTAGTAVGSYLDYGSVYSSGQPYSISLNDGANLSFNGTVTQPCVFALTYMVQEGGNGNWEDAGWMAPIMINGSGSGPLPQLAGQFMKWTTLTSYPFFRDDWNYGVVNIGNSEFFGGSFAGYAPSMYFTNCLFDRTWIFFFDDTDAGNVTLQNDTFYNGMLFLKRYGWESPSFWLVENCAFDGTTLITYDELGAATNATHMDYNSYNLANTSWMTFPYSWGGGAPNTNILEVVGPHDLMITNGYNWQSSWLGDFYLPTGSPLVDAGSTTADQLGLYHFTTQTNQAVEADSIVDIGYHYVATDAYGYPLDSNGDGIPDYIEDANGNGLVDNGEAGWAPPPVITSQPADQVVVVGGTADFSISISAPACSGPLTYQWLHDGTNIGGNLITTVAGIGSYGYSGDGDAATNASLAIPNGVAVDASGNIYIADTGNYVIRKVDTNGIITTVAGNGTWDYSGDGGAATNASLALPGGVTVDVFGNLFIADTQNSAIRKVDTNGIITTVAGIGSYGYSGDGGAATNANLASPNDVVVDTAGNLFIADNGNSVIRKVDTNGIITTVVGNGSYGYAGDGGMATNASLKCACAVVVDAVGNLFMADTWNLVIRKVDTNGIITTVVGNGSYGYAGDGGAATNASLAYAFGVALDAFGNLFIADSYNYIIREVTTQGVITTMAGNGGSGYSGDGGAATNASLALPNSVAVDAYGNLFIADYNNNVIRKVCNKFTFNPPNFTLFDATTNDAGNYQVIVSSPCDGSVTSSVATLTVLVPPAVTMQPTNLTVVQGNNATFSVTATGTAPLSYQWYFDGTNQLLGATNSSLTLNLVQLSQTGNYSVIVTNNCGALASSNALLTVLINNMIINWLDNWNEDWDGLYDPPLGLTNAVAISAGEFHYLALKNDGTVVAWGDETGGKIDVPANLTNVAAVCAGYFNSMAVLSNGTVVAWGTNQYSGPNVAANLTGVKALAAGWFHTVALLTNGMVVAWGTNYYNRNEINVPVDLSNVTAIAVCAMHSLALKKDGTIDGWGDSGNGVITPPAGLSNVVSIAAGFNHSVALKNDGTVVVWGDNSHGQTNVPAGLTNVTAIAACWWHSVALKNDGTVVAWGDENGLEPDPSAAYDSVIAPVGGLNQVVAISAARLHALALRSGPATPVILQEPVDEYQVQGSNATFTAKGVGLYGVTYQWQTNGVNLSGATNATLTLTNVQPAQAGVDFTVVVTDSAGMGSLVSSNAFLILVAPPIINLQSPLPTNQVAIYQSNLVLNVSASAPSELKGFLISYQWLFNGSNIVGATSASYTIDATATSFGTYSVLVSNVAGSTNAIWLVSVYSPSLLFSQQPADQYQIAGGSVTLVGSGVSANSVTYQWAFDGVNIAGATNGSLTLTNVQAAQDGVYAVVVTDNGGMGSLASSNANLYVITPPIITYQSAPTNVNCIYGNYVSLAATASAQGEFNGFPLRYQWQFNGTNIAGAKTNFLGFLATNSPGTYSLVVSNAVGSVRASWQVANTNSINVTNDLLLIYNTNSADSTTVFNYYLAHRPGVGGANVLGIGCNTNESITSTDFTNQILMPYLIWLNQNPTKRPQYLVLFLDIPSIVANAASVQYQLYTETPGGQPFVTSINMNGTNDCIGYINKLAAFGTNGQLVISASAGNYGNTNYVLDNVRYLNPTNYPPSIASNAITGLIAVGVQTNSIYYLDGYENGINLPHLTNAVNVAGYICWGWHSSLGSDYATTNGTVQVKWSGNSGWWIIRTEESFNGQRAGGQFLSWFSSSAFGGTNYSNTPVGGVTYVNEPLAPATDNAGYFGMWASGKSFAICAWNTINIYTDLGYPPAFQMVGDPFVTR